MRTLLCCVLFLFVLNFGWSQDLVYQPKNPAFGGDTFNYNWLLSSAQAQDKTEDPDRVDPFNRGSDLNNFSESLNRQLLNQLSRQIVNGQFGESSLEDGSYAIGDFQIDISSTLEGVVITVFDAGTGERSEIVIPYY